MVKEALHKAEQYKDYNIFISMNSEAALKRAAKIDEKIKNGETVGPLAGVPYAIKDNFLSPDGATTAASHILEPFVSPLTATAVKKLNAAGAICIGRTNLDSFAHGSSTENSYFGPTLNSKDQTRVAGGSSGGSAVAVALGIVQFATGTDTGGSIRQPASFNGVYGLKPTYGAISRYGIVAMASSTDVVGFFTNSAADLDLLMSVTAGKDPKDLTTLDDFYNLDDCDFQYAQSSNMPRTGSCPSESELPVKTGRRAGLNEGHMKIGLINGFENKALTDFIKNRDFEIVNLDMPSLKYALPAYYIIGPAEVSSNLSRYDGVRYGLRAEDSKTIGDVYQKTREQGFMPENKRRIMNGNFVLSSGFYDAYFLKAAKARTLIIKEYDQAFKECNFILTPVAPNPAFKLGEKTSDPVSMYLEDVMSVPINLAGLPAVSFPAGEENGLPVGLQLIGPRRSDKQLINFVKELKK